MSSKGKGRAPGGLPGPYNAVLARPGHGRQSDHGDREKDDWRDAMAVSKMGVFLGGYLFASFEYFYMFCAYL